MAEPDEIIFYRSGEWTGAYFNGRLVKHGDHYLADEWLQEHAGVTVVDSDAWLLPDGRTPLWTTGEVVVEQERRAKLKKRAEDLRDEAAELMREAEELEAKAAGKA